LRERVAGAFADFLAGRSAPLSRQIALSFAGLFHCTRTQLTKRDHFFTKTLFFTTILRDPCVSGCLRLDWPIDGSLRRHDARLY
jgi:hypothetical protein